MFIIIFSRFPDFVTIKATAFESHYLVGSTVALILLILDFLKMSIHIFASYRRWAKWSIAKYLLHNVRAHEFFYAGFL